MGLLSKLGKKKLPQTMTKQEALVTFICLLIVSEMRGRGPEEGTGRGMHLLKNLYDRSPIFAGFTSKQDDELTNKVLDWIRIDPEGTLPVIAGKTLLDGYEETAFAMACDIALANGEVSDEEEAFLTKMYEIYTPFPEDRAIAIMSTFASLYRP